MEAGELDIAHRYGRDSMVHEPVMRSRLEQLK